MALWKMKNNLQNDKKVNDGKYRKTKSGLEWLLNSGFLYHIHTNKLHTNHIANLVVTTSKAAQT